MTDDLLHHFIIEARDLVQQAADDLLALDRDPTNAAYLDSAFRAVHTLKGSVGLFDFAPMGHVLHAAEDVLGGLKSSRGKIDSDVIDGLLDCIGQVERWVSAIEEAGRLPAEAAEEGYQRARRLRSHLDEEDRPTGQPEQAVDTGWIDGLLNAIPETAGLKAHDAPLVAIRYTPRTDCFFAGDDPVALLRSIPDLVAARVTNENPWPPAAEMDPFACNLRIEALSGAGLETVRAVFRFVPDQVTIHELAQGAATGHHVGGAGGSADRSAMTASAPSHRTLRVDAARIDRLADLVSEMVIAKNALAHLANSISGTIDRKDLAQGILASQAAIDRLVADMHRAVMDVRMMPMRDIFRRFPRAVRDSAGQLGRTVDFSMEGEDVEADKSIAEGLFEPLLHVLRNAVAHGAEPENVRIAAGKSARTRIVLRARRDGDRVLIEVGDDGRGIDPETIRRLARERSVLSHDQIEGMSDAEAIELIFAPGFSTAAEVTDLSGRGVGMDAVRSAVGRLGGQVGVDSAPGSGTTIRISLPLTMVMTKVMAVRVGNELYGIPMDGIIETAFVPAGSILPVQDSEAFVLRDRTLPLIRLADLLNLPRAADSGQGARVVVMMVGDEPVGIAVDGFAERMDVLMRPMSGILAGMSGITGTTLLGDGSVLMILDIPELIG